MVAQQAVLQQRPLPKCANMASLDCVCQALVMLALVLTCLQVFKNKESCLYRTDAGFGLDTPDIHAMPLGSFVVAVSGCKAALTMSAVANGQADSVCWSLY